MTSALLFERNKKSAEAQELVSAVMTSAYLLEEAGISNADISISVEKRRESQVTVEEAVSLFKKLTTANVTVKNDENQQMVRDQQMKKAAGALSIDDVISSDITISRKLLFTSSWYLEIAIEKRCRLHKLIRQSFAFALRFNRCSLR
ncbi:glycerophosphodiester phosphodiesterase-like protein [Dorcoceras hygrometricum]|uniref:Glycerophosphodiester phosphodiesterase-like protein n=1 Tax=Dorcoceras hygrometricum TaxID=472368 RepID=A0A2Z6ZUM7_9LAMI|nr:glycerophosphodiester phosphodiesterase-like protein [Dorcoceras hygrometricum]